MGNVLESLELSYVLKFLYSRAESSVETENLVLDQGGQGEESEYIREHLPDPLVVVLFEALIVEPVDLVDFC